MNTLSGNQLCPDDRRHVLAAYVHRYTREHVPAWARREPGRSPVQFASDAEWLANTFFRVRKDGRLDRRARFCESSPTWPDGNPSLLKPKGPADVAEEARP